MGLDKKFNIAIIAIGQLLLFYYGIILGRLTPPYFSEAVFYLSACMVLGYAILQILALKDKQNKLKLNKFTHKIN